MSCAAARSCSRSSRSLFRTHHACRHYSSRSTPRTSQRGIPLALAAFSGAGIFGYFSWQWLQSSDSAQRQLSYAYFTPLTIRAIKPVTSDSSVVSLSLPKELLPDLSQYPDPPDTPLQAIYVRQPELQIQRAYTPLSLEGFKVEADEERSIELLIKRYRDGEVSSYVHRQGPGDQLWVRGPVRTWTLPDADELIFIAGGTGLTPLIQLLSQREKLPKSIKLVYSASNPERSLLSLLPSTEGVSVHQLFSRLTFKDLQKLVKQPTNGRKTQIVVCGPEDFITDIAGRRSLNAHQDPVGGMLAKLGWREDQVKKL
ncbi:hypothetical protein P389DRAFT_193191 [Cystobasidium minutum MCA 4210]|uniref:uncharacterized protein n=1 Tax=Cystobasidium minutum MCA 4210 TaxID=1397322 RepID=UPI0034CEEC3C|eukprot:jgi/Rhomi1/193191/gm1.1405_g